MGYILGFALFVFVILFLPQLARLVLSIVIGIIIFPFIFIHELYKRLNQ